MKAGSILPVTIHNNKLYFLFGKENPMEDSASGWSDFGGGIDKGETPYITALREGGEELTGFLGDNKDIRRLIRKNGGTFNIDCNEYRVHMFYLPYDDNLPKYFNQNHKFLWERMDKNLLNNTKLFEKIEIQWFSIDELKQPNTKLKFRHFYKEMVDLFIKNADLITTFVEKNYGKKHRNGFNYTRKRPKQK